ncbi:MAG: amidohydrolase family protein [Nitrosospira sp.]|nr:amidohydrolase family protein [Nitrosospira sp.]
MIIDAHIHCSGEEKASDVLQVLDQAKVDKAVLLAPFLSGNYSLCNSESLRAANRYLARLIGRHADRLIGFAVINPALDNASEDLRNASDLGLRGLKMVPAGWYPYDECVRPVYEMAAQLRIPILFHSGIFIDGKSGRYCRPTFYEAIRDYPDLRVTLAHLGWPWSDEANAVGLIDLINGIDPDNSQFRFDISFGAPPVYRLEVLKKAIAVLTPELLQFGSDVFLPCSSELIIGRINEVKELLDRLEIDEHGRRRIMGETAAAWLRIN